MHPRRIDDFVSQAFYAAGDLLHIDSRERIVRYERILACEIVEYLAFAGIRQAYYCYLLRYLIICGHLPSGMDYIMITPSFAIAKFRVF